MYFWRSIPCPTIIVKRSNDGSKITNLVFLPMTKGITPLALTNHGMLKPGINACWRNLETYLGTYDFCNISKKPWHIITPWKGGVMFGQRLGNVNTLTHHYPLLTIGKRIKYGSVDTSCNKPYLCNYCLGWNKK